MKQEGLVTEIQRFSLNDGPGIRTTVFLKGCNLNCTWCHNPETISIKNELMVHPEKCIGCGHCVPVCPSNAHQKTEQGITFERSLCSDCGKCAEICFPGAMKMAGEKMSVESVMNEIMQDIPYYQDSNGGVTLSGGEVFCQIDFAEAIVDDCRKNGISIAVETNLFADFKKIRSVLEKLDLIMFDLKIFDFKEHQKWTGIPNERIKENILLLDRLNIPLIARTPLIPNATDSNANICEIAKYLSKLKNIQYYELLNFNPLADSKYQALGRNNPFAKTRPLSESRVKELQKYAENENITTRIG